MSGQIENIKVAVRVRPMNDREKAMGVHNVISMSGPMTTINHNTKPYDFNFDYSFWSCDPTDYNFAGQEQVYTEVGRRILDNGLAGFNGCLFAYGQTGSGKSYTMTGYNDYGVIPRLTQDLFKEIDLKRSRIWVSYIEIYQERIKDLLSAPKKKSEKVWRGEENTCSPTVRSQVSSTKSINSEDLTVFAHPKLGVVIQGVTEVAVRNSTEVGKLLDYGQKNRAVSATNMNAHSSRSHAVYTLKIETVPVGSTQTVQAKLNLIDLAGSERSDKTGATGKALAEGSAINQSLTTLGLVINELTKLKSASFSHIPFRNSKLTFLLKDSLSGNSKTFMIAAISPSESEQDETLSTLRFASSVKTIKTTATVNKGNAKEMESALKAEIEALRKQLLEKGGSQESEKLKDDLDARTSMMESMRETYERQLEEAQKILEEREQALKMHGISTGAEENTEFPYLLNISEDPMLSGCLCYNISSDFPLSIGSDENVSKVVLNGLGCRPKMCELLSIEGNSKVELRILDDKCRILVNGKQIKSSMPLMQRMMKDNDRIMLGRAFMFRLVVPKTEAAKGKGPKSSGGKGLARKGSIAAMAAGYDARDIKSGGDANPLFSSLELMRIELEESLAESQSYSEIAFGLEELEQKVGDKVMKELTAVLADLCPMVDEANDITAELRPVDQFRFDLEPVWDQENEDEEVTPEDLMLIRVLHKPNNGNKFKTRYLWSVWKFRERVSSMRDIYHRFHNKNSLERAQLMGVPPPEPLTDGSYPDIDVDVDLISNPWLEPTQAELAQTIGMVDLEARKQLREMLRQQESGEGNPQSSVHVDPNDDSTLLILKAKEKASQIEAQVQHAYSNMQRHLTKLKEVRATLSTK